MASKKLTPGQLLKRALTGEVTAADMVQIAKNLKSMAKGEYNDIRPSDQIRAAQLLLDRMLGTVAKEEAAKEANQLEQQLDRVLDVLETPPTPTIVSKEERIG